MPPPPRTVAAAAAVDVVCTNGPGPIVSSRKPDDLPQFNKRLVEVFAS